MKTEIFGISINFSGLLIGAFSYLMIIIGRYSCIAGEYHFSKRLWRIFLITGGLSLIFSLFAVNYYISSMLSIFGFTYLWGIAEIIKQEERVKKGWFPENPKKKDFKK